MKRFGSPAKLQRAEPDEIAQTPGVGPELAQAVYDHLHGIAQRDAAPPAPPALRVVDRETA